MDLCNTDRTDILRNTGKTKCKTKINNSIPENITV